MKIWPKVYLGRVAVDSNIAQDRSFTLQEVVFDYYWPQFRWKVDQKLVQVGVGSNIAENHSSSL